MESSPANRPAKPAWADTEAAWSACLILGAVLAAYLPALSGGLLWDDDAHVTKLSLRSLHGLWRIWFDPGATQQYYPFLHSVFWVEHLLWGGAVLGYHLANVAEHAAAAWLLYVGLRMISFPAPRLPALLFALHPVCVESVAWISEQKNTLSAVFYVASALLYLNFDASRRRGLYSWALALFVLALLTKTVTATLPAALLVLFWWRRGRLEWKADVSPLLPWFAIAACSGLFTAWTEVKYIGATGSDFSFTIVQRLLLAGRVVSFYAGKVVWPSGLMFIYPRWTLDSGSLAQWVYPVGVLAALVAAWVHRGRRRWLMASILFFIGTLFPALGFVNVYPFKFSFVADHFQYLASIGLILPLGWGIWWAVSRTGLGAAGRACLLLAIPAALGFLSWRQARIYRDSETLYRSTIAVNPSAWLMHYNLAVILGKSASTADEAIAEYRATLGIKPDHWEAHNNLGSALLKRPGGAPEAVSEFEAALRANPAYAEAENNLGVALEDIPDRLAEAPGHFRAAIRLNPSYDAAHSNLGSFLMRDPSTAPEAAAEFAEAVRLDPNFADYHYYLGNALVRLPGRESEAIGEYRTALRLDPDNAEAHSNLGVVLSRIPGHADEAIEQLGLALRLDPANAEIHDNLANALVKIPGRKAEAADEYRASLRIDPSNPIAHFSLGLILAGSRAGLPEAIGEFEAAVRLRPDFAEAHFALGVSYAMAGGRRREAIGELEEALRIRPDFPRARRALAQLKARP